MSDTDLQLLARYTRQNAEDAFAEIVRRHLDLVFSAALRLVRSRQLAEEVAQSVFIDLGRQAEGLAPDTILTAWLYQVSRRTAIDVVRREARRQIREQAANELNAMNATDVDWTQIEPLLDEAMHTLDDTDRAAVLLRYFESKSLHEVGQMLGASEDAARKRISRAVERLREFFAKRGITVGASGLVVVISTNAVQAAPVGLAGTISTSAALSIAAINTTTIGLTKTLTMTTIQKTLITTAIAVAVGTGIYEARKASRLQEQTQALQQQQDSMAEQNRQLQKERDEAARKLAEARQAIGEAGAVPRELLKLRAEVTKLRGDSQELAQLKSAIMNDPTESAAKSWLDRVSKLKQGLEQMPGQKIPELQFVTEQDWLNAVKNIKQLETGADFSQALSSLRNSARNDFALMAQKALRNYAEANNGQLPGDFSHLKPYFALPVDDAVLQRYELTQTGVITGKASPIDDEDDTHYKITMDGMSIESGSVAENTLKPALQEFSTAHYGLKPSDPSQLLPYVKTPAEQAALQKLLQNSGAK